jgi:hypothetical protein
VNLDFTFLPSGRFFSFVGKISSIVLAGCGGAVLAGAVVAAAFAQNKELAVAIAVVGTAIGTFFLSLFLPKVLCAKFDSAIEDRASLERSLAERNSEIQRLERSRINLDSISEVLKLVLVEVEMHHTDFKDRQLEHHEPTRFTKERDLVYRGAVSIPIKAQLGIDLAQLRLHQPDNGRLIVSNLVFWNFIDTSEGAQWLLSEIRNEYKKDGTVVEVTSDYTDRRSLLERDEHERDLRRRIKEGQNFKQFEPGMRRSAKRWLRMFLAPMADEIEFTAELVPGSTDFVTFLKQHNEAIRRQAELTSTEGKRLVNAVAN